MFLGPCDLQRVTVLSCSEQSVPSSLWVLVCVMCENPAQILQEQTRGCWEFCRPLPSPSPHSLSKHTGQCEGRGSPGPALLPAWRTVLNQGLPCHSLEQRPLGNFQAEGTGM